MGGLSEISVTSTDIEVADVEKSPKGAAAAPPRSRSEFSRTSSQMSLSKMMEGEPKTELEKSLMARLAAADTNQDGKLSKNEVIGLVKDLVLEQKAKSMFRLISVVALVFLIGSLCANFGLVYWGVELSKEAHVARMTTTVSASAAAPSSVTDPTPAAMTASDGNTIIGTAPATTTLPIYVAPVMSAAILEQGDVEVTFEVYDFQQLATDPLANFDQLRRSLKSSDYDAKEWMKSETLKVESIEKLTDTHIKFKGVDGTVVEVKDGEAYVTIPDVPVGRLLSSPALAGSKESPHDTDEDEYGFVKVEEDGMVKTKRYNVEDIAEKTVALTQPICGCTFKVPATTVKTDEQLSELKATAITKLDEKGVNVEDMKGPVDSRRRQLATAADNMKMPASFASACSSPIKQVLAPVIEALADAHKKANKKDCDPDENPACYACTDSTLGCEPIEIEHEGRLSDHANEDEFDADEDTAVPPVDSGSENSDSTEGGDGDNRRVRRKLQTDPDTPLNVADPESKKVSKLFVSEKVGSDEGDITELYIADEGICGVKAKGDESKTIKAIAFKPCVFEPANDRRRRALQLDRATGGGSASTLVGNWTRFFGVRGLAIEKAAVAAAPATASKLAFGAAPTVNPAGFEMASRRKLLPATGFDDAELPYEWIYEGKTPIDAFKATGGLSIGSLEFTSAANYTTGSYVAKMPIYGEKTKLGEGEGKIFPSIRKSEPLDAPTPIPAVRRRKLGATDPEDAEKEAKKEAKKSVATLGTRLVGALIKSDTHLASISFIFKDDCKEKYIDELSEYVGCKGRVKQYIDSKGEGKYTEAGIKTAVDM